MIVALNEKNCFKIKSVSNSFLSNTICSYNTLNFKLDYKDGKNG